MVRNGSGTATSNEAVLTVTTNSPPSGTITSPVAGTTFTGGQTFTYSGTGTDPEAGNLPASAFTWEIKLFHNDGAMHNHPFYGPATGAASGTFTIPTVGETSPNIWYRVYLTVQDAAGLKDLDSVDINPLTATVTLVTNPAGLQVKLDATPYTSPRTFTGVVNSQRTIEAVSPQTLNGVTYQFASWSDGGAQVHTISTPSAATTYTATFTPTTTPTCNYPDWVAGNNYAAGSIVRYPVDGKFYIAKFANPGYIPTVSTYYWSPYTCTALYHPDADANINPYIYTYPSSYAYSHGQYRPSWNCAWMIGVDHLDLQFQQGRSPA